MPIVLVRCTSCGTVISVRRDSDAMERSPFRCDGCLVQPPVQSHDDVVRQGTMRYGTQSAYDRRAAVVARPTPTPEDERAFAKKLAERGDPITPSFQQLLARIDPAEAERQRKLTQPDAHVEVVLEDDAGDEKEDDE